MKNTNIVRSWKDPLYRSTLKAKELAELPTNPAGLMEIADANLLTVNGGMLIPTIGGCTVTLVLCVPYSLLSICPTTINK